MNTCYPSRDRQRQLAAERQRRRRREHQRIDYYPDEDVLQIIDSVYGPYYPLNSRPGLISHIIREWERLRRNRA